jgi:hypothetical protein
MTAALRAHAVARGPRTMRLEMSDKKGCMLESDHYQHWVGAWMSIYSQMLQPEQALFRTWLPLQRMPTESNR